MQSFIKKLSIIIIFTLLISNVMLYTDVLAIGDILSSGDSFLEAATNANTAMPQQEKLKTLSDTVSGVLLTIALGVTLISAFVMAINFAIQSVEDKAKVKEAMVPWIIGILISFGAFGIWELTMTVFGGLL